MPDTDKKYHIVYKVTLVNSDKYYIGMHSTNNLDDGYIGTGKLIRKAIKKYGKDSFEKDILFVYNNRLEAATKEAELVTEDVIDDENSYNLILGGESTRSGPTKNHIWVHDFNGDHKVVLKDEIPEGFNIGFSKFLKNSISEGTKKAMENHDSTNYKWITNPSTDEQQYIKKDESVPEGWVLGMNEKTKEKLKEHRNSCEKLNNATKDKIAIHNKITGQINFVNKDYVLDENEEYGMGEVNETWRKKILQNRPDFNDDKNPNARKVSIYGKIFNTVKDASKYCKKAWGIGKPDVIYRLKSSNYVNWQYIT